MMYPVHNYDTQISKSGRNISNLGMSLQDEAKYLCITIQTINMKQGKNGFNRRDFVVNSIMAAASLSVAKFGLAASNNQSISNSENSNIMNDTNSTLAKRKLGSLEVTEL